MKTFAEVKIIFKGDPEKMEAEFSKMEDGLYTATEAIEACLKGQLEQLGSAGLKPYLQEDSGSPEIPITK